MFSHEFPKSKPVYFLPTKTKYPITCFPPNSHHLLSIPLHSQSPRSEPSGNSHQISSEGGYRNRWTCSVLILIIINTTQWRTQKQPPTCTSPSPAKTNGNDSSRAGSAESTPNSPKQTPKTQLQNLNQIARRSQRTIFKIMSTILTSRSSSSDFLLSYLSFIFWHLITDFANSWKILKSHYGNCNQH